MPSPFCVALDGDDVCIRVELEGLASIGSNIWDDGDGTANERRGLALESSE